ncbi:MAG: molybdopterin molybdenumtransferase MoeA, partial [Actinobacteria bacterium]|nr:molybdopterin molybdenumtransferase MoeA [Actinomycetota bacterium]NIU69941.1 molybdopterin molybdenumtransferase MoeA [Actinomycetota bacterium]NIW31814.1 molybdopterin molybdenumtransferase MoeA [Actinomycetota bacterium]NIX23624.1 molybdopterin molybdenumtransferase MoeA [Actinomycetota bacterium]
IAVRDRFTAGVLATGTEIHEGRTSDLDSPMLAGLVEAWGGEASYE